jgi:hypothetical protein
MFPRFARPRSLALVAGLSLVLVAPLASQADEPNLVPAPEALPRIEHLMGSGGLGSRLEETLMPCTVLVLPARQHLLGSGGLGSTFEDTLVPVDAGSC